MTGSLTDRELVERATRWRDEDPDPTTQAEVSALVDAGDLAGLRERFGERLQFGTAGLRGAIGAGPNRMNRALVRRATAGVAAWLREQGQVGRVVVGRDARNGSDEFARDAARVLTGAGFDVARLANPMPTPVTAFAVTHLDAVAGVMITASHNPPMDNGYKLYLADGAQIVSPTDDAISAAIDAVGPIPSIPLADDDVEPVDGPILEAYLRGAVGLLRAGGPREVTVVYTPLHGVAAETIRAALALAGFPPAHEVVAQAHPDPDFPTVTFPNPEEPGALDLALRLAGEVDADVVIANDPDGDRLAVAAADPTAEGRWRALTGDELGCLLADHLLRTRPRQHGEVLVTTVVSSRLLEALAHEANVDYAESLTGFKWVVRAPGPGRRLLFGYEEALGYCVGELVHDKDGITAALVALELVAELKAEGRTIFDRLADVYARHGAHATGQQSLRLEGADWLDRVSAAMQSVRVTPPTEVGGRSVHQLEDLALGTRLPASDVLVLTLDGARLVLRPSGTEPKVKCYAEAVLPVPDRAEVWRAHEQAMAIVGEVLDGAIALLHERGV